jgi:ubiquitin-protein ligase
MENRRNTRLKREQQILAKTAPEFKLQLSEKDLNVWYVSFECPKGTIYENEKYTLRFRFPENYVY